MKNSSGFTLIEVLVSVVVLSTGIIFVLHAFNTAALAMSEMRDTIWSGYAAQCELDKIRIDAAVGGDPGSGYSSGTVQSYYGIFRWDRRIEPAGIADSGGAGPDIRRIMLVFSRDGSGRTYQYDTLVRVIGKDGPGKAAQ